MAGFGGGGGGGVAFAGLPNIMGLGDSNATRPSRLVGIQGVFNGTQVPVILNRVNPPDHNKKPNRASERTDE